jgi:hypothetical protein
MIPTTNIPVKINADRLISEFQKRTGTLLIVAFYKKLAAPLWEMDEYME